MVRKTDSNSEKILAIFPKVFWTDTRKKRVSKSGVAYSSLNRVKLLHNGEKGIFLKFLLSDAGCLLLQLTAVTTLGYLQKKDVKYLLIDSFCIQMHSLIWQALF